MASNGEPATLVDAVDRVARAHEALMLAIGEQTETAVVWVEEIERESGVLDRHVDGCRACVRSSYPCADLAAARARVQVALRGFRQAVAPLERWAVEIGARRAQERRNAAGRVPGYLAR